MPRLFTAAVGVLTLAAFLACTGGATEPWPDVPREEQQFTLKSPPDFLKDRDLPWYGGKLLLASDTSMTVACLDCDGPGFDPKKLHEVWHEAFLSYGWENESYSVREPRMSLIAIYKRKDGPPVNLLISQDGSVWYVSISTGPPPDEP